MKLQCIGGIVFGGEGKNCAYLSRAPDYGSKERSKVNSKDPDLIDLVGTRENCELFFVTQVVLVSALIGGKTRSKTMRKSSTQQTQQLLSYVFDFLQ